jgi:hypothetical protein
MKDKIETSTVSLLKRIEQGDEAAVAEAKELFPQLANLPADEITDELRELIRRGV